MGKFFKYAKVLEINTMESLLNEDPELFHHVVAHKDDFPNASIGLSWKDEKGNAKIFIDPDIVNPEKARSIRRHELVHYLRDKKDLPTARWSKSDTPNFKRGFGTFVEELAAIRGGTYSRTLKDSPLNKKISNKIFYPIEEGFGAATGKSFRFNKLRKLIGLV